MAHSVFVAMTYCLLGLHILFYVNLINIIQSTSWLSQIHWQRVFSRFRIMRISGRDSETKRMFWIVLNVISTSITKVQNTNTGQGLHNCCSVNSCVKLNIVEFNSLKNAIDLRERVHPQNPSLYRTFVLMSSFGHSIYTPKELATVQVPRQECNRSVTGIFSRFSSSFLR